MRKHLLFGVMVATGFIVPGVVRAAPDVTECSGCVNAGVTTCTIDNFFVDDGDVDLEAVYEPLSYSCTRGQYISADDASYKTCLENYYCPGVSSYTYTEGVDGCIEKCPIEYPVSMPGSTSITDCHFKKKLYCSDYNPYTGPGRASYDNAFVECIVYYGEEETNCHVSETDSAKCEITHLDCDEDYVERRVDGKLECVPAKIECKAGTYLPAGAEECALCDPDNYCGGDDFYRNDENNQGIKECPDDLKSPAGSHIEDDCGRLLHIGDKVLHMHRNRDRERPDENHVVAVHVDGVTYYANTTPVADGVKTLDGKDVPLDAEPGDTEYKTMRIKIGDEEYSVHERIYDNE
jgi:hypothetical protein